MASRKPAAYDVREQDAFDPTTAVAHNDSEPFAIRDVRVALGLRARLASPPGSAAKRRVASR